MLVLPLIAHTFATPGRSPVLRLPSAASVSGRLDGAQSAATLAEENELLRARVAELEERAESTEGLCELLDDGGGWTSSLRTRASWLLGLLVCQSASSLVLAENESLLLEHPTVIFFMTMLVDPRPTQRTRSIVSDELLRAAVLAFILVVAGLADAAAISASLFLIVSTSVVLGTLLPLLLQAAKIDAAHASTTIQVVMDVLGVLITCSVAPVVFGALAT
ncbi:hypothetical protein EMIHUDRAFT_195902 [Emiliania huxleyi CCMP1516]|uniref:SLC41A/MgtE integral membrane domain-containing protein n=2 Tax=Emiliania huxleyi TaxID=2903 RepID=A0A0D3J346_EMIH1|nr:hypothetical protein EMIHUDRAFT_195902 [Emiliania huxleyi CCMP1516]EOD17931.1 hypothetical protein EMIHUDRAFT_195902 [Emiliania huxleyi CCMP1516]|eukprot:XP_005770360.1 hypothetical protein EMIHUDRAFT_195902 [Emiliania huxleyi CCMP1516]